MDTQMPMAYKDAHKRVSRKCGKAAQHTCIECGKQAQQWSLRHDEPAQQCGWIQLPGRPSRYWVEWSAHPEDYDPMCRACHRKRDDQHKPRVLRTHCDRGHDLAVVGRHGGSCAECARIRRRQTPDDEGVPCTECGTTFATDHGMKSHRRWHTEAAA
jgi:hypothetical protein